MKTCFSLSTLLVALLALAPASSAQSPDGLSPSSARAFDALPMARGGCAGTLIDFNSDASGSVANGFVSDDDPNTQFASLASSPDLQLRSDLVGADGNQIVSLGSPNETTALQFDFVSPVTSLEFVFANDDPSFNRGEDAVLTVYNGATFVSEVRVVPNFNDLPDQTIGYTGAAFNRAVFEYDRATGSTLAEVVDDVCVSGAVTGPSIDIAINSRTTNPMRGESVFFRGPVTNNGASTEFVYVYTEMDVPGFGTFKRNIGGKDLAPGETFQYKNFPKSKNFFPLTNDAPAGTYTVRVFAASDNQGTVIYDQDSFQFTLDPLPCAGGCLSAPLPTASSLEVIAPHAAPNPFRADTEIRYALAETAEVDLRVFDVTGREVAALVSGTQSEGTHSATLRAGDLPSGVYVWRLTVGGEVTTGRITLAR